MTGKPKKMDKKIFVSTMKSISKIVGEREKNLREFESGDRELYPMLSGFDNEVDAILQQQHDAMAEVLRGDLALAKLAKKKLEEN